jgi:hypothetical protein
MDSASSTGAAKTSSGITVSAAMIKIVPNRRTLGEAIE